jgi:hypothetical protein
VKWYFALSDISLEADRSLWEPMVLAAVRSCEQNTDLDPHFVFDGEDDPFVRQLERAGVTVVRHRVSFYDALAAHRPDDETYLTIASGAFLRTEIPVLEVEDQYVLYTDCDVIFTGSVDELAECRPAYFACAPEFEDQSSEEFNSGVMVMNLPALRSELEAFRHHIVTHLGDIDGSFDQPAFRSYYRGRSDELPMAYNWRPFWGVMPEARIVHFHGPKPRDVLGMLLDPDFVPRAPVLFDLFDRDRSSYRMYLSQWLDYAGDSAARN